MRIKIDQIDNRIQIDINPKDYFLVEIPEDSEEHFHGSYGLVYRIDMSYKGKADQCGPVRMYLSSGEAEKLRGMFAEYYPYP